MGRHSKPSTSKKIARNTAIIAAGAGTTLALSSGIASAFPGQDAIIKCESGGNYQAKNKSSTASGAFQIINGTWKAYGGLQFAPTARQATPAQQQIVADRIYAASGTAPWNASKHCWGGKIGKAGETKPKANAPKAKSKAPKAAPKKQTPKAAKPAPKKAAAPKHAPAAGKHYVVKQGDYLVRIAAQQGVDSWHTLYDLNRQVIGGNPNLILPGQDLVLPQQ